MATLLKAFFQPPAMKRCECAELPFEEIGRRLDQGQSFDEIAHLTGCGRTCTACVSDLEAFLRTRGDGSGSRWSRPPRATERRRSLAPRGKIDSREVRMNGNEDVIRLL